MKIVKFGTGEWALRKFSFSKMAWVYKDLAENGWDHWWEYGHSYFHDCLAHSEEELRRLVEKRTVVEVKKL